MKALLRLFIGLLLPVALATQAADDAGPIVVIAHPSVARVDAATLQRLYTGRSIEVAGTAVTVVNAAPGSPARDRFFLQVLGQDDDRYVAYWTVRRHIGKGAPPRDLKSAAEIIDFVQSTPGGIGYIAASDMRPGLNVVLRP